MYRVLIADDEPIERAVICKTIEQYFQDGIEILVAENGRQAIQLFTDKHCSAVVLDIEMPGINGLEAARTIRTMDKDCSIIFLTAFDQFSYAKQAIAVQALDYLLKPVADKELLMVIEEGIRQAEEKMGRNIIYSTDIHETGNEEPLETMEDVRLDAVKKSILNYIKEHFMADISLQDISAAMKYSEAYFCKVFKQCFGKNYVTYLAEYRINKAKQLLADVTVNIKEISSQVGYRDSGYFARVFKRHVGLSPSEYRLAVLTNNSAAQEEQGK